MASDMMGYDLASTAQHCDSTHSQQAGSVHPRIKGKKLVVQSPPSLETHHQLQHLQNISLNPAARGERLCKRLFSSSPVKLDCSAKLKAGFFYTIQEQLHLYSNDEFVEISYLVANISTSFFHSFCNIYHQHTTILHTKLLKNCENKEYV